MGSVGQCGRAGVYAVGIGYGCRSRAEQGYGEDCGWWAEQGYGEDCGWWASVSVGFLWHGLESVGTRGECRSVWQS